MSQKTYALPTVRERLPTSPFMIAVLGGDLLVLFAFIATGQYAHDYYFWQLPAHTIMVMLPFVIAWFVVAPVAGLFSVDYMQSYTLTVALVVLAWIAASLLGGLIRATEYFPGGIQADFVLANVVFGILFFVPWRLFVSWRLQS